MTGSVTFDISGIEIPLVVCDMCEFQTEADDFDLNAKYCIECSSRGVLSEMIWKTDYEKCETCGMEEEIEKENSVVSSL